MKHLRHSLTILLAVSMLLNAVLGWRLYHPVSTQVTIETSKPDPEPPPAANTVFDWKQLEAPDFATYIANLRRAGCPEATIRHLIEPELHAVFESRRQNPAARTSEPSSSAAETAALAALLGSPWIATEASSPPPAAPSSPKTTTAPVPAAFLVGNAPGDPAIRGGSLSLTPTDATLAPETLQTLSDIRQEFGNAVKPASDDPTSREFYLRWLKAQRLSDDRFSSLYGGDHFMRVQQQANLQQAMEAAQTDK